MSKSEAFAVIPLGLSLIAAEEHYIKALYESLGGDAVYGNKTKVCQVLGIDRKTLNRKLAYYATRKR